MKKFKVVICKNLLDVEGKHDYLLPPMDSFYTYLNKNPNILNNSIVYISKISVKEYRNRWSELLYAMTSGRFWSKFHGI